MKTAELTGSALAWAVGIAEGYELSLYGVGPSIRARVPGLGVHAPWAPHHYWNQGGPIIEREDISFRKYHNPGSAAHGTYYAQVCRESGSMVSWHKLHNSTGPTPLIAAMRCYVASKLGDTVEIPPELESSK